MPAKGRLFILDANALLHRAWHAIRPLTNPEGQVVNCVYGMLMSAMKLVEDEKPDMFVACWDTEAPTFRDEIYSEYKANRVEKEHELYDQIPWIKEGFAAYGIPSFELDGFEADDLLGTISAQAVKAGWGATIVTGDRDALQLVKPGIDVLAFVKGVSETKRYNKALVKAEYALTPEQFLEYKALRGDPSDNIPGVKGIGEKTATELLTKYGTIKEILKAAKKKDKGMSDSVREKLLSSEKEIPDLIKLVTIVTNAPIKFKPKKNEFPIDREAYLSFLHKNGFKSLIAKLEKGPKEKRIKYEPVELPKKEPIKGLKVHLERVELTESGVKNALADLQKAKKIIVRSVRKVQAALFASEAGGIILANSSQAYLFSSDLVAKHQKEIQKLLDSAKLVAHDGKDEMKRAEKIGLMLPAWDFDLMLGAYMLGAGERNHDLGAIAANFVGVQIGTESSAFDEVDVIAACVEPVRERLKEEDVEKVLERFELPLIPVLHRMENYGVKIDKDYLLKLAKEMSKDKAAIEKKMIEAAGTNFNPGSPTQLADVLFVKLGLPSKGIKRGKTGFSTAAPELAKLAGAHPILEMIEEYREVSKLLSTYVEVLPTLVDNGNRVHTTFDQAVAATGRLSSNDPNLQNIPIRSELGKKIRRSFIAEEGFVLLSCDYSQIELRLVAALAKDKAMLAAFEKDEDVHTATASQIWNIPLKDVTKDQRRIAKAINFGLIFGQGPQGLSQSAGISFKEAKEFIEKYFQVFHGIKSYMVETKALAQKLGYVETMFGRKRYLPEIHSSLPMVRAAAERMAINMPVQGSEADLIKLAMIEIDKKLGQISPDARMLLQVHDELLFEVKPKEAEKVAEFAKDIMENVEKVGVKIVVEAKVGKNWEEMKPLEI